ncbi:T9SS type A sorting domain-containing protein [candidate division KSB1 bacterium]|nr:T9SS type A sorting domain-containing protein [candidate division KSB1 bacterium]
MPRSFVLIFTLVTLSSTATTALTQSADSTGLVRFNGQWKKQSSQIELIWVFGNSTAYSEFEVQRRSADQPIWKTLGKIDAGDCSICLLFYSFEDPVHTPNVYFYRLKLLRNSGNHTFSEELRFDIGAHQQFSLGQNYPNPFNSSTTIHYWLNHSAIVRLIIYDIRGREVRTLVNGYRSSGFHTETWHANNSYEELVPSGVYLYRMVVDNVTSETKRIVIIK